MIFLNLYLADNLDIVMLHLG